MALLLGSQLSAQTAAAQSTASSVDQDEVVQLSPFVVSEKEDQGYHSQQTMVGSRSAKDIIDLPVSVSIAVRTRKGDTDHLGFRVVAVQL